MEEKQRRQKTDSSDPPAGLDSVPTVDTSEEEHEAKRIALFGAHGSTGKHFLRLALDAGYHVNVLHVVGSASDMLQEFGDQPALNLISGDFQEPHALHAVIQGATYVVCMLNDTKEITSEYPAGHLPNVVRLLYSHMRKEPSIKVFLYQATSLAADVKGDTPVLARAIKSIARRFGQFSRDTDKVMQYIARQHGVGPSKGKRPAAAKSNWEPVTFAFIVTRPTILLKEAPPFKKLAASKSQPGLIPMSFVDLAEFSLNALLDAKLYNACPYVVADCF